MTQSLSHMVPLRQAKMASGMDCKLTTLKKKSQFTQKFSMDYFDTLSPIVKLFSFRIIPAIATYNNWDVDTFE